MNGLQIAAPVQRYLDADASMNMAQFSSCFTRDAKVRDEGKTFQGVEAITAWKKASREKYTYQVQPLSTSQDGNTVELNVLVTGDFKGSPVELTYHFVLSGDRIAELAIK
jgi:hypothetical protein